MPGWLRALNKLQLASLEVCKPECSSFVVYHLHGNGCDRVLWVVNMTNRRHIADLRWPPHAIGPVEPARRFDQLRNPNNIVLSQNNHFFCLSNVRVERRAADVSL